MNIEASLQQRVDEAIVLLQRIERAFAPAAFANSLGAEDMVLTDLIVRHAPSIEMFTLDTGRLHEETYRLMQKVTERYGVLLRVYFPQAEAVEEYVSKYGVNGFYANVDQRKACCHVRKVEPLARALKGKAAWITGLRRQQSVTRHDLPVQEFDTAHRMEKFNPLVAWSEAEVWAYIHAHDVPANELHARNFPSIGCEPCTRAITPGEDLRAGRWWWENPETKECGLHMKSAFSGLPERTNNNSAASEELQGVGLSA